MIMKKIFDYVDQNFDRMMEEMKEFCSHRTNFRKWRMEMP